MINKVYLAGPFSSAPEENTKRAIKNFHKLMDYDLNPFIPHLFYYAEKERERPYKDWLDLDLRWLEEADSLVRLSGKSPGSDVEVEHCKESNTPYFLGMEELEEYLDNIGQIFVIMGPSGSGKTTLVERLMSHTTHFEDRYKQVVSCTSRDPRDYEKKEGGEYRFMSDENMSLLKKKNKFVEHVEYRGNQYGFLKEDFDEPLSKGKNVVVVANKDGYHNLEEYYDSRNVYGIVTLPYNGIGYPADDEEFYEQCRAVLANRMEGRGDDGKDIAHRLEGVEQEIRELRELAQRDSMVQEFFNDLPLNITVDNLAHQIGRIAHDHHQVVYERIKSGRDEG